MLKHLQELLAATGELDIRSISTRADLYRDVSLTGADEIGVVFVDDDGSRTFVPWQSVISINLVLGAPE